MRPSVHLGGLCDWQHCWCTSGSGDTEPNFQTQPLEKDARTEHSQREQKKSGFSLKLEKLASIRLRVCCSVVKMEFACKEIHEEMCVQDELYGVCLGDHLQYHRPAPVCTFPLHPADGCCSEGTSEGCPLRSLVTVPVHSRWTVGSWHFCHPSLAPLCPPQYWSSLTLSGHII